MWKSQITGILDAYSLLDHLEDPTPCPPKFLFSHPETETQEVNPLYTQWIARDKALFSLISSTLSPSAISLVMGQTSASGIWKILVNKYTSVSKSNIVNLKRELNSIKKNSDSVTDYLNKIKEARNKLVSVGIHIDDEEILHIVLQGLPSEFHSFTSAMLTKNEAVKFEELHTLMKTEEDLLRSATDNSKEIAHMAMVANKTSQPMYNNSSTTQFGVTEGGTEIKIVEEEADSRTTTMAVEGSVKEASTMEVISPISPQIPRIPNLGLQTLALAQLVRSATS
jgi:hypothetical protein